MEVLRRGGSALDAVEAAICVVESNPEDHTVGLGGLPNILGVVELDASIMDGHTLAAGAVAAVRGFEHPIAIARRVLTELPHVLLVAEGAERFARECGFAEVELLTEEAGAIYARGLKTVHSSTEGVEPVLAAVAARMSADPERAAGKDAGTVNVLSLDSRGHLASGVSTSGWAWKYPGRVGDSAIIGAGNYCDDRFGAATCTGRGEMAMRTSLAHSVIAHMRVGASASVAGVQAMRALERLVDPYFGALHCIVLDPRGVHAGFSTRADTTYVYMDETTSKVRETARTYVPVVGRMV
jgi:beta-aspartyl-peptidase (threonine type)